MSRGGPRAAEDGRGLLEQRAPSADDEINLERVRAYRAANAPFNHNIRPEVPA